MRGFGRIRPGPGVYTLHPMLGRKQEFNLKLNQIVDSVLLALAFWLAYAVRSASTDWLGRPAIPPIDRFYWQLMVLVPFTPLVLERIGFYSHVLQKPFLRSLSQAAKGLLIMVLVTSVISTFGRQAAESRAVLLIFPFLAVPALLAREAVSRMRLRQLVRSGMLRERVVFAGPPADIDKLIASLPPGQIDELQVVGRIDISREPVEHLVLLLHEQNVERVIFAAGRVHLNRIEEAVNACELEGVEAWLSAEFIQTSIARPTFDAMGGKPMLVFRCTPEVSWALFVKSLIDKVGALVLLLVSAPFMLAAWLGIRITSPGPAIFSQMRCGRHGKPFRMYKFRTMTTDAEQQKAALMERNQMSGPVFKVENDPRIFPFGRLLRKYSIDELPQLINVLSGDMSLVGPRPLPVDEVANIADAAHRRRLSVNPGLTCLWQISGRNEIRDFDRWVALDLEYIDNWSLWLDIKILLRTIPAVLLGSGAR
jgi:exopolysaccharide biosynthesis polyprenyl glycosylphosphotransferase